MEKVIEVKHLKKTYDFKGKTSVLAVRDVSFSVKKGEIFGILGPNGAGKTTTLEIIEGLKEQTSGEVLVLGMDNLKNVQKIKQKIGIQLQSSDYLPHLTLQELMDLFASLYDKRNPENNLLALVDLEEKKYQYVKNLSGGQKQRFSIATSLVNSPEIIFLDEPTTGLDPSARRNLWQLVKKINASGVTIVLTTHYMEEAEFLCNRVAIMDSGTILEIDEPRKLIDKLSETTQVSFFTDHDLNEDLFKGITEVTKIYTNYPKITVELSSLDNISQIVKVLKENKVNFSGFNVKTASLEDVYLDLTGREYQE